MSFGAPGVLWGLCGPALGAVALVVLALMRRRRTWSRWPGITRVVAVGAHVRPVGVARGTRRPWALLLALALTLFSLARPRWGVIEEPVIQKSREVMLALDLSRSMLAQDVPPSRLERARLLVRTLLDRLRGERVGLIVFAGTAFVQVPMSTDYQIISEFLPELKPDTMPQGGSDYEGMLRAALGGFSNAADTDRYLIVLSDGEAQDEVWRKQLPSIKDKGIRVIALGIGTTSGGFIPDARTGGYLKDQRGAVVLSRLEPATLQTLAFETGGTYRDASTWVDLAALLQETVERGRQTTFSERRESRAIERFQWFLLPALLLTLFGLWREIPVRPRPRIVRPTPPGHPQRVLPRPARRAAAILVAAITTLLIAPPRTLAAVADTTPADPADKLRTTVARLAAADSIAPAGWKAMAEQTLELGRELRKTGQPLEPGLVRDGLAAVDQGEAANPRAADWPKLREELRRLLQPPEQQNQNEQQQQEEPPQPQQDKQDRKQPQSGPQQGQPDKNDPAPDQSQDQQQKQERPGQQQQTPPKQDSALGELEKPAEQPPAPQPQGATPAQPQTRKFGGRQDTEQKPPPADPELAAALARLDQVKANDSPARLHQRIEEEARRQEGRGTAPSNPRDW